MMNSPVEKIEVLDDIIRQLHKADSKMQAGQFIAAYRDIRRIIAYFEQARMNIIADSNGEKPKIIKTDIEGC